MPKRVVPEKHIPGKSKRSKSMPKTRKLAGKLQKKSTEKTKNKSPTTAVEEDAPVDVDDVKLEETYEEEESCAQTVENKYHEPIQENVKKEDTLSDDTIVENEIEVEVEEHNIEDNHDGIEISVEVETTETTPANTGTKSNTTTPTSTPTKAISSPTKTTSPIKPATPTKSSTTTRNSNKRISPKQQQQQQQTTSTTSSSTINDKLTNNTPPATPIAVNNNSSNSNNSQNVKNKNKKRRESGTSSDEERWLTAIETGKIEEVDDELKKMKDPKLMTARQRAMYERGVDGNEPIPGVEFLMSLPTGYREREKPQTAEEIQKAALKSQRRKQQADEKREKDKKKTMERLLKKQDTKQRSTGRNKTVKVALPMITYKNTINGATIQMPPEIEFPLKAQISQEPPKPKLCGIAGCDNLKIYNCSKTNVPLCSIECYKKNVQTAKKILC